MKTPIEVSADRLRWLESLTLDFGNHDPEEAASKAACLMEAVAYVAGEPWSNHPKCASRVITQYCVRLNDLWSDVQRQALKPYVLRIVGTENGLKSERKRAFICTNAAVREFLPLALDERFPAWAEKLRALTPIINVKTARVGRKLVHEVLAVVTTDPTAWAAYVTTGVACARAPAWPSYAAHAADATNPADIDNVLALDLLDRLIKVTEAA